MTTIEIDPGATVGEPDATDTGTDTDDRPWSPAELEARLRGLVAERYHNRHPFNVRMHDGDLSPDELRTWVLNRFHYQRNIPVKDAHILAKLPTPELRRMWLRRIQDHDGVADGEGGIERWLRLGEAVGIERARLLSGDEVLGGVRLAVDGYVNLCRHGTLLEAVAASLTELLAPAIMHTRTDAFERHYRWVDPDGLEYFRRRVSQGRRDSGEALPMVLAWATTRPQQDEALAALAYKCHVLWTLLDAIEAGGNGADGPIEAAGSGE